MSVFQQWGSENESYDELIQHFKKRWLDQKFLYFWWWAEQYYGARPKNDPSQSLLSHSDLKKGFDYVERFEANLIDIVRGKHFALISLGCGNSCQEKPLLIELTKQGLDFVYIGVDSSQSMLELTQENLKDITWLKIHLVCADIFSLHFVRNIRNITSHYEMNIFSFLGRTFGNLNQTSITDSLYNILRPDDYVRFDALSRDPNDTQMKIRLFDRYSSYLRNENKNDFYLTPLHKVGVPSDHWKMILETSNEPSTWAMVFGFYFLFTKKTVVNFRWEVIHFLPDERVNLIDIRNYDWQTLIDFFENHNFQLINHEKGSIYDHFQMSHFIFKKPSH